MYSPRSSPRWNVSSVLSGRRRAATASRTDHLGRLGTDNEVSDRPSRRMTMVDRSVASEWDYAGITRLVTALRSRQLSATELIGHTIARIEALDVGLNAVVVRDFERATEAAREADAALARGDMRPL